MTPIIQHVSHTATHRFSRTVLDYVADAPSLRQFISHTPDWAGILEAVKTREAFPTDRETLCSVLEEQYLGVRMHEAVRDNLNALLSAKTFTVCTAHQPNLATGYLYFIYKILHAVRLSRDLCAQHPDCSFVPVYYMGSEDADLEELGTFRYGAKKFVWDGAGQRGAVGRMHPQGLQALLDELFSLLGPPGLNTDRLKTVLRDAYEGHKSIAAATRYLVNELLGEFGVVVLDGDDADFKRALIPVFREDLFRQSHEATVRLQADELSAAGYDAQAFPRPINLFYLGENSRDRIELHDDKWVVVNTDLSFSLNELDAELMAHPERFSPNVVLRPLLQETILPNVAFIGGGAEVAYWLQLKPVFEKHDLPFPPVILRASAQWISPEAASLQEMLQLSIEQLFSNEADSIRTILADHEGARWEVQTARETLDSLETQLRMQATAIDSTLGDAAGAAVRAMDRRLSQLEAKMLRAEKRKHKEAIDRWHKLQDILFPNGGLQERVENLLPYYAQYGQQFFRWIIDGLDPLGKSVLIGTLPKA